VGRNKNCEAGQATEDNMAHTHFMLDNLGYKHKQTGCVILNDILMQQWMHEHTSMSRYVYMSCPVYISMPNLSAANGGKKNH